MPFFCRLPFAVWPRNILLFLCAALQTPCASRRAIADHKSDVAWSRKVFDFSAAPQRGLLACVATRARGEHREYERQRLERRDRALDGLTAFVGSLSTTARVVQKARQIEVAAPQILELWAGVVSHMLPEDAPITAPARIPQVLASFVAAAAVVPSGTAFTTTGDMTSSVFFSPSEALSNLVGPRPAPGVVEHLRMLAAKPEEVHPLAPVGPEGVQRVRIQAVAALGKISDLQNDLPVLGTLGSLLADPDPLVRAEALDAVALPNTLLTGGVLGDETQPCSQKGATLIDSSGGAERNRHAICAAACHRSPAALVAAMPPDLFWARQRLHAELARRVKDLQHDTASPFIRRKANFVVRQTFFPSAQSPGVSVRDCRQA